MEQSLWGCNNFLSSQIPCSLWLIRVNYRVRGRPLPAPVQVGWIRSTPSRRIFKVYFYIFLPSTLRSCKMYCAWSWVIALYLSNSVQKEITLQLSQSCFTDDINWFQAQNLYLYLNEPQLHKYNLPPTVCVLIEKCFRMVSFSHLWFYNLVYVPL
jgi:hypothetical protein